MASSNENDDMTESLSDLYDKAFKLYNDIMNTDEPTNSLKVQVDIKKCMSMLENATKLVSLADMFSSNEEFDEVPTENLKYFLLPVLLGTLTTKLCNRENRLHYVDVAEVYFYDFLERVKAYGITNIEIPTLKKRDSDDKEENNEENTSKSETQMIEDMVNIRKNKIQRYKQQKQLKEKLETLKSNMNNPNIDDETKRQYFVTLIELYIYQAIEDIVSLDEERKILKHMSAMKREEKSDKKKDVKTPKLQSVIITRNLAQKEVFGAGYPSLPVMTVEEFYEKKVADGEWAPGGPGQTAVGQKSLQDMANNQDTLEEDPEVLQKEELVEKDDEEYLAHMRDMDEYKDTHKRGWGNRYNRS
ncbi:LOW QUALITY PROTEIN: immunoglobulin-binding protein 1 [Chelonus insularis]|uniref:LOW QUALITY PROTEIN: immunoglobulin-binding protein 1 n=1 Tax=Chelonus insularis TaxID=460826 RepID=UPI00158D8579|nr:LOW QUALITY PROTEIN: immunoglobulin-binding protein 1 [Chelonus insularis]